MHHHTLPHVFLRTAAAIVALAMCTPLLHADPQDDLARENQQLRERVATLESELAAARERIQELESTLNRLRRDGIDVDEPEPRSALHQPVDEDATFTDSPRALFHALRRNLEDALAEKPIGEPDSAARAAYLRAMERWRTSAVRQHRGHVTWHVNVLSTEQENNRYRATVVVIDPTTEERLSDAFTVTVPSLMMRRYRTLQERGEHDVMVVRGQVVPQVTINEDRRTPGAFDYPPLIGPFAEFTFEVQLRSFLHPDEEPEPRDDETPNPDEVR